MGLEFFLQRDYNFFSMCVLEHSKHSRNTRITFFWQAEVQDWEANCQACLANLWACCFNIHQKIVERQDQLIKMYKWKVCQISKKVQSESAQGTHINENAQTHEWYTSIWPLITVSNFEAISAYNGQIGFSGTQYVNIIYTTHLPGDTWILLSQSWSKIIYLLLSHLADEQPPIIVSFHYYNLYF